MGLDPSRREPLPAGLVHPRGENRRQSGDPEHERPQANAPPTGDGDLVGSGGMGSSPRAGVAAMETTRERIIDR